jgi:hypothetical protein
VRSPQAACAAADERKTHGAEVARYSMPVARGDRNAAGEVDARIIGELRAVVSELTKRSNAAHASNADG